MSITGREREVSFKSPWINTTRKGSLVYLRHRFEKGVFFEEIMYAWPEIGGVKYENLPE